MSDFRSAAIDSTRKQLGVGSADALRASAKSGVIDLPEHDRHSLAPTRMLILAIVGLSIVPILTCVVGLIGRLPGVPAAYQGYVAMLAFVIVGAALIGIILAERSVMTNIGRSRPASGTYSEVVAIEPTSTYNRIKALPDDVGMLRHDAATRRLIIEGAMHCYVICSADVDLLAASSFKFGSGVQLDVQIGAANLSIILSSRERAPGGADIANPRVDEPPGSRQAFRRRICDTLGIKAATDLQTGFDVLPSITAR